MRKLEEINPEKWASMDVPDVYFMQQYYEISKVLEKDFSKNLLLEWVDEKGRILFPLMIRKIPSTSYYDTTTAYGYGGPWIEGEPDLVQFAKHFDLWAKKNNVVCTFLRFHPLIKNAETFRTVLPVRRIGPTAAWNLKKDDGLIEGMAKGHRKTFRRAHKAGLEIRIQSNPVSMDEFKSIYHKSMNRLSADGFYHFEDGYWKSALEKLGTNTLLVEAIYEDETVAAVWCLFSENFLHFHLSGTTDEGRRHGGSVLCRVAAAQWAKENGINTAHFGGGVGGEDSTLLTWKRRFDESNPPLDFYVSNLVHLEEAYSQIAAEYEPNSFFPPWRSPKKRLTTRP